jgi:hypothetical protein
VYCFDILRALVVKGEQIFVVSNFEKSINAVADFFMFSISSPYTGVGEGWKLVEFSCNNIGRK